jgi:hypothetical protein
MADFATTVQTSFETYKSFAEKTLAHVAENSQHYVSVAKELYENRPSVDESFDKTVTTIMATAPSLFSQVQSHFANINPNYTLTDVDKTAILVVLGISALAAVMTGLWLIKKFFSCLVQCVRGKSESVSTETVAQKPSRKSASPKRASRKAADAEAEEAEETETAEEIAPKSVSRRQSTKTPRMRTPSQKEAKVTAEPATVEATPAPAKVLDFGVTPKNGAVVEEASSKKVNKAEEAATPRRSARLACLNEKAPMPAVEETEPVTLPAENPTVEWEKLTIPDLKAELRRRGEKVSGNKADLVERLQSLERIVQ